METLFHLFSDVENDQVQMASTESFFMTLGQGSPPKISGDTVTVHQLWPTQFCNNKVIIK